MANTDKSSTHQHTVRGTPTTSTGVHSHALTATDAALAAITARIKTLEAQMADVILTITKITGPTVPPGPGPVPPPVQPPVPPPIEPTPGTQITVARGGKGVVITANNQVVENVVITGPGFTTYDGSTYGIYGSGAYSGVIIRHCTIRKMGHSGIWLVGLTNVTIEDCVIEDVAYAGIMTVGVAGGTIQRNTIRRVGNDGAGSVGNNAYGIAISGTSTRSSDIDVLHNTIDYVPMWHGLDTHGGLRITFHGNTVRRAPRAIFVTSQSGGFLSTDCVIDGNLFTDPIQVTGGTNPTWATTYDTRDCSFTNNHVGSAYASTTVYDYTDLSTGLTESGNTAAETLP